MTIKIANARATINGNAVAFKASPNECLWAKMFAVAALIAREAGKGHDLDCSQHAGCNVLHAILGGGNRGVSEAFVVFADSVGVSLPIWAVPYDIKIRFNNWPL